MTDEELIEAYLKGDEEALSALIRRHMEHVYNFLRQFIAQKDVAEDVTQETFVKVWKNLKKFDQTKKFTVWLFRIARNTAIDYLRKKKELMFSDLTSPDEDAQFDVEDEGPSLYEVLEQKESVQKIDEVVRGLPAKYQEVIHLYYREELNLREIAEISGESFDTVKSRHRRAIKLIKDKL